MLTTLTIIYLVSVAICLLLFIPAVRREPYASTGEILVGVALCTIPGVNTACLFWVAVDFIQMGLERMGDER